MFRQSRTIRLPDKLSDLVGDVDLTLQADGKILKYNATTEKWECQDDTDTTVAADLSEHEANTENPHAVEATQISDFDTEVSNNEDVSANTINRHTHGNKLTLDGIIDMGSGEIITDDERYAITWNSGEIVSHTTNTNNPHAVAYTDFELLEGKIILGDDSDTAASAVLVSAGTEFENDEGTIKIKENSLDLGSKVSSWINIETINSATTLESNTLYLATVSSSYSVTLPASPENGVKIEIKVISVGEDEELTINRNGNNIEGTAEDLIIKYKNNSVTLIYYNTTGWIIV